MAQKTSTCAFDSEVDEALALLRRLTPTPRQQRVLLGIARFFYSSGTCFARQVTIAAKLKIAKTTLQREIADLELLGYLYLTRREGTSTIMTLKPGLIEAFKKIRRSRRLAFLTKKHSEKKSATFSRDLWKSGPNIASSKTKPENTSSARNSYKSCNITTKTLNGDDGLVETPKYQTEIAEATALLVSEGVTASRAASIARYHDAHAIRHAVAVGVHRTGRNPAAYLCHLIVNRITDNIPHPNSEAAVVRSRQRTTLPRIDRTMPVNIEQEVSKSTKGPIFSPSPSPKTEPQDEALTALFDRLDPATRIAFESQATVALSFKPAFMPPSAALTRITQSRAAQMYFEATHVVS